VAALGYVLNEVTHLHALQRVSLRDLKGASPMTMEYVRTTLGQDDAALFEENPEAVSAAANFLTASSGGDRSPRGPARELLRTQPELKEKQGSFDCLPLAR